MKKFALLCLTLCCCICSISAKKIKDEPNLTKGQLENGFTYYIKQNTHPKGKIELRLVVNAGSALEEESQRGLAHFLEHMAFSGTRDFPGKQLIDTLQSIGVHFGKELNAYTSFDETVYSLPIPAEHADLGIRILSNWALHLNLTEKAIDRERGVILEEMRLGENFRARLQRQYLPVLFEGSPYSNRLPIGTSEVISGFKYDELRRFYKKWYRPENIGIVVVGDIQPEKALEIIKQYFGTTQKAENRFSRLSYFPTPHQNTRVVIATDPEKKNCSIELMCKHRARKTVNESDFRKKILDKLYNSMIAKRLEATTDSASVFFSDAEIAFSNHFRFIDTYSLFAICNPDDLTSVFTLLVDEHERATRYGFLNEELESAKKKLLAKYGNWYKERNNTSSDNIADNYQFAFLYGQSEAGIEWEYLYLKQILPLITTKDIAKHAKDYLNGTNQVISITGPDTAKYASEETLKAIVNERQKRNLLHYQTEKRVLQLMDNQPEKGKIINEEFIDSIGVYRWTLSNGLKVLLKPTQNNANNILFRSTSDGGYSMYGDQDVMSAVNATLIQDKSGVNHISNSQLKTLMNGKNIAITQSLSYFYESMWGRCSKTDIKDFFQLIYLYHVRPYFTEQATKRLILESTSNYKYLKTTPESSFDYFTDSIMNGGNFRRSPWPLPSELQRIDGKRAKEIYNERFSNASGFTYIFVGNMDLAQMREMTEQYIASLPTDSLTKAKPDNTPLHQPDFGRYYRIYTNTDNKSTIKIRFRKDVEWNKQNALGFDAFIDVLNSRLFESLRMQLSGVYGVKVSGKVSRMHQQEAGLNLTFGCKPENVDTLLNRTIEEISRLWNEGPSTIELNRYKEKAKNTIESARNNNASILTELFESVRNHELPETAESHINEISGLSIEQVKKAIQQYIDPKNSITFILLPQKK